MTHSFRFLHAYWLRMCSETKQDAQVVRVGASAHLAALDASLQLKIWLQLGPAIATRAALVSDLLNFHRTTTWATLDCVSPWPPTGNLRAPAPPARRVGLICWADGPADYAAWLSCRLKPYGSPWGPGNLHETNQAPPMPPMQRGCPGWNFCSCLSRPETIVCNQRHRE